jgi:hypothetical protein
MLQKNLPILDNFGNNEGTLDAPMRFTDIERTIYDIKMDSNNTFEKIDLNENIIGSFNINQPDFELSNNELIFWNVETNKCFIISNTDGTSDSWGNGENDNCMQNEKVESQTIGNDLSQNIEEMRKILETNTAEVDDDVEEEMRKMFDENHTSSILEGSKGPHRTPERFERNDPKQTELNAEETHMEEDLNNFQLEESHYEQIIEIASEQLVESCQTDAPTLCCVSDKESDIELTTGKEANGNTVLEHFQPENVKSIIADSIDEKLQRLQEIRNRISKIHIHLNKKRKYYESFNKIDDGSKRNKSMNPILTNISKQETKKRVTQSVNLKKKRNCRPKRVNGQKKILIRWRKKFEKQINTNYSKQVLETVKTHKGIETNTKMPTKIISDNSTPDLSYSEPSNLDIPNSNELKEDEQPESLISKSEKVSEIESTTLQIKPIVKFAIEAQTRHACSAEKHGNFLFRSHLRKIFI